MPDSPVGEIEKTGVRRRRVMVLGATGTIGRATVQALVAKGHDVVCFVRPRSSEIQDRLGGGRQSLAGAVLRFGDVTDPKSLTRDGFAGEGFDALVSCLASRTGAAKDAWAIDHAAHVGALAAARASGVSHMVLLSAICVQKPRLAFQHAKLAFEEALISSGLRYSIVRPTAFFKSLSGQIERIRRGKPYLLFGDGRLTACKPIGTADLAAFLAGCLDDEGRHNRVLAIGGPGKAITPIEQGEYLFERLGLRPRFRHVPVAVLDAVVASLDVLGRAVPLLADKAELARIGRYYATESMLLLDAKSGRYDADATPSFGRETLFDYYDRLIAGEIVDERGEHAVF